MNEATGEAALVDTLQQRPDYRTLEALIRWGLQPLIDPYAACSTCHKECSMDACTQACSFAVFECFLLHLSTERALALAHPLASCLRGTAGSNASKPLSERLRRELRWNQDSLRGR